MNQYEQFSKSRATLGEMYHMLVEKLSDTDKNFLSCMIELIVIVDKNYQHIVHVEVLQKLMAGGLSQYYKEYCKDQEECTQFCSVLADNTRWNHYKKADDEKLFDVYDVCKKEFVEDVDKTARR